MRWSPRSNIFKQELFQIILYLVPSVSWDMMTSRISFPQRVTFLPKCVLSETFRSKYLQQLNWDPEKYCLLSVQWGTDMQRWCVRMNTLVPRNLPAFASSSRNKAVFEHSDVYKGLPIVRGHFSLKEKVSHLSTPQEFKDSLWFRKNFGKIWRSPWPLTIFRLWFWSNYLITLDP